MLTKWWQQNRRVLTEGERHTREELVEQGAGDPEEALNYAAVSLRMARNEQERLWDVIRGLRLEVQRLQFPLIYPPQLPEGAAAVARRIYEAAAYMVALMDREGMRDDYEVTYSSLAEIAGFAGDEPGETWLDRLDAEGLGAAYESWCEAKGEAGEPTMPFENWLQMEKALAHLSGHFLAGAEA